MALALGTYSYRYTVLLVAVGKFHNELRSGSLLAVVQGPKSTDDFDAILRGDLTFRRHFCRTMGALATELKTH